MSLTNLVQNRGPLVRTLFVFFLYVLKSLLLVFWMFLHQHKLNPKSVKTILHQQD